MMAKYSIARELSNLLNNGYGERKLHEFLKKHKELVLMSCNRAWNFYICVPEFRLGSDFRSDFLIISSNSINWYATFIELKSPTEKLYTKNGTKTEQYRLAEKQISEWREWIDINESFLRKSFSKILEKAKAPAIYPYDVPGHKGYSSGAAEIADLQNHMKYDFHIIIGRSSLLSPHERASRARDSFYNTTPVTTPVATYDRLLSIAKRIDELKRFQI